MPAALTKSSTKSPLRSVRFDGRCSLAGGAALPAVEAAAAEAAAAGAAAAGAAAAGAAAAEAAAAGAAAAGDAAVGAAAVGASGCSASAATAVEDAVGSTRARFASGPSAADAESGGAGVCGSEAVVELLSSPATPDFFRLVALLASAISRWSLSRS